MKRILNILILLGLMAAGSCFEPPEFSNTPTIEVKEVRGKEVAGASTRDSLIVTVNFRDGDGDIGLDGGENGPPYNQFWFFLKSPRGTCEPGVQAPCTMISYIDESNLDDYITYSLRRTTLGYDTLPAFVAPYNCTNYYVLTDNSGQSVITLDTLYSQLNPRRNNFFMELLVKNGADFIKYDFSFPYPICEVNGLDGRLPILAKDGNFDEKLPLEGSITYKVTSPSFYSTLRNKTLKVRVRIMDRAGNISNEDFSEEFTLK